MINIEEQVGLFGTTYLVTHRKRPELNARFAHPVEAQAHAEAIEDEGYGDWRDNWAAIRVPVKTRGTA